MKVQIVTIHVQYGLEIASPSPKDRQLTSCVMISRGEEVHIPNAELRSSAELLTEHSESRRRIILSGTVEDQTGAAHVSSQTGIKETCEDTISISPSQASFLHIENHSYD